jgi:hypothetical protein
LKDYKPHRTKSEHSNAAARWTKHIEKGEGNPRSSPDSCGVAAEVEYAVGRRNRVRDKPTTKHEAKEAMASPAAALPEASKAAGGWCDGQQLQPSDTTGGGNSTSELWPAAAAQSTRSGRW